MAKRKRKNVHYLEKAIKSAQSECPDGSSLMLFVAQNVEGGGSVMRYAGARIDRENAISMVKRWLYNQGEKENWMEHID